MVRPTASALLISWHKGVSIIRLPLGVIPTQSSFGRSEDIGPEDAEIAY